MRAILVIGILLGSRAFAASAEWAQVGGGLTSTPSHSGIAGQGYASDPAQGGGIRLQSGFLAHRTFHLNAPFVTAPIDDRAVGTGFAPIRIALGGVFADLDGDTLRYLQSATGASAQGRIENDTLVLSWVDGNSGTTEFTVIATDGVDTAKESFALVVEAGTAVTPREPSRAIDTRLDVRVPKLFANAVQGAGEGNLGPEGGCQDGKCLSMDILLPGPSTLSVHIYDNLGTAVLSWSERIDAGTLSRIRPDSSGRRPVSIVWNLRTLGGRPVSSGVYLWRVEARTDDGQRMDTIRRMGVKSN